MRPKKILIAYFSRKGNNYVDGRIVNLAVGNTELAAKKIQELAGGELFRIDTLTTYPADYEEATEVAKKELRAKARPELLGQVDEMEAYNCIILGYPNWWGTAPMAVFSFLEAYDFSGKTILPFCTHEGSGLGHSEADIKKTCPGATLLPGLAIVGGRVGKADREIEAWLGRSGVVG